jgi:N-acyl homoserine lactone hydrolase
VPGQVAHTRDAAGREEHGTTAVDLDVMLAGEVPTPHAYVFRPPGNALTRLRGLIRPAEKALHMPLLAFAVRHPSAGPILIDTGLHPDAAHGLRGDYGLLMSMLFRKLRPADQAFDQQLRGLGIEPGEVKLAVMTHLHVDHTSGMRLLPQAEFVCSRSEWSAATGRSAVLGGYAGGHLPPSSRMRFLDFGRDGEPYGPFSRSVDLLGDGSIRLLYTPGHSRGHMSVLLRLREGRRVLLVGDAAYTLRSIREEALPLLTVDDELYLRSVREIKAYADQEPGVTLVPTHDPTAWQDLRRSG